MMRIHKALFALGLLLALTPRALTQPGLVGQRYQKFLIQHINGNMNENICDQVIRSREITQTDSNDCKGKNTFIQASARHVRHICADAGTHYRGTLFQSNQPFPVVTCTHRGGARYPRCEYRGHKSTRYIVIGCEDGWPVHYEEDAVVIN